jgi:prepilin-type N-terminal cleavage/methylation domain-containing protein
MMRKLPDVEDDTIRGCRRAMTLVELLIAMVITGLVAAGAASILFATSQATDDRNDVRRSVVRSAAADTRLRGKVHSSRSFLAAGADELVLWANDENDDGVVNLGEILFFQRDGTANELRYYEVSWPGGWTQEQIDAANTAYAPATDFSAVAASAKTSGNFSETTWATGVYNFAVTLDGATPQAARVATIRLTFSTDGVEQSYVVVGSVRAPTTPG